MQTALNVDRRARVKAFHVAMDTLAKRIISCFATGLGHPADYFDKAGPMCTHQLTSDLSNSSMQHVRFAHDSAAMI